MIDQAAAERREAQRTVRRRQLLRFIRGYMQEHAKAPSYADMAAGVHMSRRTVFMLSELSALGLIRKMPSRWRDVRIAKPTPNTGDVESARGRG